MHLFAKDKRIILELDCDSRQSSAHIAKKIGLSKQNVNYTLHKLIKNKIISSFRTVINAPALGYQIYNLFIKRVFDKELDEEFITYMQSRDHIAWLAHSVGAYDYLITLFAQDVVEVDTVLGEILRKFHRYITSYDILPVVEAYKLPYRYLSGGHVVPIKPSYAGDYRQQQHALDSTDLAILEHLDRNARVSATALAKDIDLAPNVIAYRIKRLRDTGIIQGFRAVLNTQAIEKEWHILLFLLEPADPLKIKKFRFFLEQHPSCVYLSTSIGTWQLIADFHVTDSAELDGIINEIRSSFGLLIKDYTPLRIPSLHKSVYFPTPLLKK